MADKYTPIDETTLEPKQQDLLQKYRVAYKMARDAKAEFEASVSTGFKVPSGFALQFGYYWGKLGVKLVPASEATKPSKPSAAQSLASFLSGQLTTGRAH